MQYRIRSSRSHDAHTRAEYEFHYKMNRRGEDHTDKANLPVLCFDKKFRNDLFRQSKDLYTNPEDKVAVVTTPSGTVEWKRPISRS